MLAGSFQAGGRITLGKAQDAKAGAEALLGMRLLAQDDLDEDAGGMADLGGLALDALRRPIGVALMARWHVLAPHAVLFRAGPSGVP